MAGGPGGVVIQTIVWRCRDHNSIAVDVDVGRGRPLHLRRDVFIPPILFPRAVSVIGPGVAVGVAVAVAVGVGVGVGSLKA